jgi:Ca-activated chloride channel family protein
LANDGDGCYYYVDTLKEAERVFVENLSGTLQVIAYDAKIQVEFNPEVVSYYRLIGYENRDVADQDFRNDAVDAGEVGSGHSVTALYEVKLKPGMRGDKPLAEIRLRWRSEQSGRVREDSKLLRLSQLAPSWERATPALRLASVVAELAEILRGSYWAKDGDLDALARRARRLASTGEPRVIELAELIERAAGLKRPVRD